MDRWLYGDIKSFTMVLNLRLCAFAVTSPECSRWLCDGFSETPWIPLASRSVVCEEAEGSLGAQAPSASASRLFFGLRDGLLRVGRPSSAGRPEGPAEDPQGLSHDDVEPMLQVQLLFRKSQDLFHEHIIGTLGGTIILTRACRRFYNCRHRTQRVLDSRQADRQTDKTGRH
eukprot:GHVT01068370.1.p1 GENE.GHVT01068370.1~~GHVT01068370.1.p1  ORF type:complete len:172 (+),score=28.17 GHVT01068370.1:120-635(+)